MRVTRVIPIRIIEVFVQKMDDVFKTKLQMIFQHFCPLKMFVLEFNVDQKFRWKFPKMPEDFYVNLFIINRCSLIENEPFLFTSLRPTTTNLPLKILLERFNWSFTNYFDVSNRCQWHKPMKYLCQNFLLERIFSCFSASLDVTTVQYCRYWRNSTTV